MVGVGAHGGPYGSDQALSRWQASNHWALEKGTLVFRDAWADGYSRAVIKMSFLTVFQAVSIMGSLVGLW